MHHRPGYTLMEVLVALGIFVVGFTAAASIFPVAALLQKRTLADVEGRVVARNAENLLRGRGLTYDESDNTTDLYNYYPAVPSTTFDEVKPFGTTSTPSTLDIEGLLDEWTISDRGYPTTVLDVADRDFVWFPLVRDANSNSAAPDWTFYLFLMQAEPNATYPNPSFEDTTGHPSVDVVDTGLGISGNKKRFTFTNTDGSGNLLIDASDWLLDSNGVIYTTTEADTGGVTVAGLILTVPAAPTAIYYGTRPAEAESDPSTFSIIALSGDTIVSAP